MLSLYDVLGYERSGFEVRIAPWYAIFFLSSMETLPITGQMSFPSVLKMAATVYQRAANSVAVALAPFLLPW